MSDTDFRPSRSALWLGLGSAVLLVVLECTYGVVLVLGLSDIRGPGQPIRDPYFTLMEVLILAMMPVMIALVCAIHALCDLSKRHLALAGLVFLAILATITSAVHATILMLSKDPRFADMEHVFSFQWPSVVYVLDVLAWDLFFGLFAIFTALCFERHGLDGWVRRLLLLGGALALFGLWGAATGDTRLRNIGILGYVGVFTLAVGCLAVSFWRRLRPV